MIAGRDPLPYRAGRHADPRIAARVHAALGDAHSVLHVSAGTGIYEPEGRALVAVEADERLRAARPEASAPVINAQPDRLPFEDDSFDASMSCLAADRWEDPFAVLREMRRVTTGPVVVLTFDFPHLVAWQKDYFAPLVALERAATPTPAEMAPALGRRTRIDALRTPIDCEDGFMDAYWARPEAFLDDAVRAAQPVWAQAGAATTEPIIDRLRADLGSGHWYGQHGHLRSHPDFDGALRLVVAG